MGSIEGISQDFQCYLGIVRAVIAAAVFLSDLLL